ncbi:hypothetical protein CVT25_014086 [Psilocybe cyanescens]|uniref:Cyclin n=1 Tax=Psilocybe cyanescens TaxID=93625 RepID=A0A409VTP7_PSICY|nr:hypothetical protein CVT25_014086 [Psilocybe cyanescens]
MLAVVQPYSPSPDVAHRARSTISSSSRSAPSNLAPNPPPSLQRHQTAPPAVPAQVRQPTPPPRVPTPTPPPSSSSSDPPPFDIHSYPATDLLKLLALLLTHIATTNDRLSPTSSASPSLHNPLPPIDSADAPPIWHTLTTASKNAISTPAATLTFHARNIPTISLEAYLLRILKYCPTTNHVFLSLLVYFDRMSKLGDDAVGKAFVIDSYNIHRLVIAGVTVASKFFSDVFYTNSRYAKVGGLPLPELNQLELQFLLLNDFRLVISGTEMQQYAEQLMLFSNSTSPSHTSLSLPNGHGHHSHPTHNHHPHHPIISASPSTASQASSSGSSSQTVTNDVPTPQQPTYPMVTSPSSSSRSPHTTSPARPLDALGGVPAPMHNPTNHPRGVPHTHPPHSHQHPHPPGYQQTRLHDQPHMQQQQATPQFPSHGHPLQRVPSQRHSLAQFQQQYQQDMADQDHDTEDDDVDTSTDAGTETSTDEEPTIRAPGTVAGSVGGSTWGDAQEEEDERMRNP